VFEDDKQIKIFMELMDEVFQYPHGLRRRFREWGYG
jgi:hypothetical protein